MVPALLGRKDVKTTMICTYMLSEVEGCSLQRGAMAARRGQSRGLTLCSLQGGRSPMASAHPYLRVPPRPIPSQ
jgi:hypothetical protein